MLELRGAVFLRAIPNKSKRALKPRDATPTGKRREECVGVGACFLYKRRRCAECCAFSGRIKRGSAAERQLALLGRGYQQQASCTARGPIAKTMDRILRSAKFRAPRNGIADLSATHASV